MLTLTNYLEQSPPWEAHNHLASQEIPHQSCKPIWDFNLILFFDFDII